MDVFYPGNIRNVNQSAGRIGF